MSDKGPLVTQAISHYTILEKLGEGGMGVVYKAHDAKLDRIVAIKLLPHHLSTNEAEQARFLQEARAASALNHPNVCIIYDIKEENGKQYIVMEFVDGVTLRQKAPVQNLQDALNFAIQIGEALREAHGKAIVHRDIKCENIMVNSKNQIKVMDFGLAKLKGSLKLTKASSTVGTLAYMAPEQIQGGEVDARSDIFSFGVVLFEMFTGHLPFAGEHEAAMMYSILNQEPESVRESRADISEEVDRIIHRALEKDPEDRYQHVDDMVSELGRERKQTSRISRRAPGEVPSHPSKTGVSESQAPYQSAAGAGPAGQRHKRFRPVPAAGLAFIILAAGYLGYMAYFGKQQIIDSLAVMPFENVGADPNTEYLSDGITESLINSLSQLSNFSVMSRSSVFRYKGKEIDPQKAGKELGVKALLIGRVTQRGDDLQISAELVDVSNNTHIWGEHYSRKMSDILQLQEDIAKQISANLRLRLTGEEKRKLEKRYTENSEAYQLYLKGKFFIQKATPEGMASGIEAMHEALKLDPTFPLPYVGLAYYYIIATDFWLSPNEAMPEVKKDVSMALELDRETPDAHTYMANYSAWYAWDWPGAEAEFRRALESNPNSYLAHELYGFLLMALERPDEAVRETRKATELEPLIPEAQAFYSLALFYARRNDESIKELKKGIELDPNYPFTSLFLGFHYIRQGRFPEAINALKKSDDLFAAPWSHARLAYGYAMAGRRTEALAILDSLKRQAHKAYVASDIVASVYVALGDKENAFEYLEKAYQERAGWMTFLKVDPIWDPIRSDPRFDTLLRKMKLP